MSEHTYLLRYLLNTSQVEIVYAESGSCIEKLREYHGTWIPLKSKF